MSEGAALADRLVYAGAFTLFVVGAYVLCASGNLMKRLAGLAILQGGLALFYATIAGGPGARAPLLAPGETPYAEHYANPLPQAQMTGAVAVGVVTLLLGLALVVRIREAYGTIEEDEVDAADDAQDRQEHAR